MKLKSFFLSRSTVIVLITLIFCTVLVAGFIPQRVATSVADMAKWRSVHPYLLKLSERCDLFHVFTSPWFATVLLLALVSLLLSTWEQFRTAWRRTFSLVSVAWSGNEQHFDAKDDLARVMRGEGYLRMAERDGAVRFIRHPWGYWGNFLLHAGMVLTIAASLVVALTEQRGRLTLVAGDIYNATENWESEERGLMASPFVVPWNIRLDSLKIRSSRDYVKEDIRSGLTFLYADHGQEQVSVAVNELLRYRGLKVYQTIDYGEAFTVEFRERDGVSRIERLLVPFAERPEVGGYNDFRFPWLPFELSTKYYPDAERKSMTGKPLLVMRLMEGGREIHRVSLKPGETGALGPYQVRLYGTKKWSGLIFVNIKGMPLIFIGFFIISLGAVLNYLTPPREVVVRTTPEGCRITWRAVRFPEFYEDEYAALLETLRKGGTV